MIDHAILLEKTTQVLTGTYDFQKLAQQAVDLLCKEMRPYGLIGVGILRVKYEVNEIYAYAYSAPHRRLLDAILPVPFSKLHLTLQAEDNLIVKTVLTKRSHESERLADFGKHALSDSVSDQAQKILKIKYVRSFPISSKSGRVIGVFYCVFPDKKAAEGLLPLIEVFAKQLGLAFSNVFAFERLARIYQKELDNNEATRDEANMPSIKFTLRISPRQLEILNEQAKLKEKTKAELIRDLIDQTTSE